MLQTQTTDVHSELSSHAIQNLPLNAYRNFQTLINLTPGTTPGAFQNAIADTPDRALSTHVNGTNRNNNNTRVDGASDVFVWLPHHAVYIPPAETIQEVNIATNNFDAEQGMTGGAAVTVITKSGSNTFHGSAFGYHTDQVLRARNYFETESNVARKPKSILNNVGGTFGGPIKKDKLFFFGSWDGLFERDARSLFQSVPTAALRAGDFTGTGTTIYDPSTGNPDGTGRTPFPNQAAIPIDPISANVLSFVPLPNLPGETNNLFVAATQRLNRNNYDGRIDWTRTSNHLIWGKFSTMQALFHGDPALGEAVGECACDGGTGDAHDHVYLATIGHTLTLSPHVVLDGNVGFTRMSEVTQTPDFGKNIGLDVLGIPGTNSPTDIRNSGFPGFVISSYSFIGNAEGWNPLFRHDWSFTNSDNVSWSKGKHELRFGFDVIHHHLNHWQPELGRGPRGEFDFNGGPTALNGGPAPNQFNSMAQFLLGLPDLAGKSDQFVQATAKEWQFGWYVRDRWRITQKLTASLGLRYEYYPLMTRDTPWGGIELYDPFSTSPPNNNVLLGGLGGNPKNVGVTTSKKLFAPRVGLAYAANDKTVVRAGFGMSYDPLPLARPLRGFFPLTIGSEFTASTGFGSFQPLSAGIPPICCPDISSGVLSLPGAALMRSPFVGELKRGYIESWNLAVERALPKNFTASAAYVGTQTVHQFADRQINQSGPGQGAAGQPLNILFGRTADTMLWQGYLSAHYHSLQTSLNRRFSGGLMIKGSYTYSKAINYTDDDGWAGLQWNDPNALLKNRAVAGYDRTHIFQLGYLYELPIGKGKSIAPSGAAGTILGGWQINGLVSAYSGTPFTVTASGASLNAKNNLQTADLVGPIRKLGGIGPGNFYFDPAAWAPVTDVRYGNTNRNSVRGPGAFNTDLSLFRTFPITERLGLQFRAEIFNLTNTPHFRNPGAGSNTLENDIQTDVTSGTFMQITSTNNDSRTFRFALRLAF